MIVGDPFLFAIQFDIVDEWNEETRDSWTNGLFDIYINGERYPQELSEVELNGDLSFLLSGFHNEMYEISEYELSIFKKNALTDELHNQLIFEKKIVDLASSAIADEGVSIYFLFSKEYDYIALKENKDGFIVYKYNKEYIFNIFNSLSRVYKDYLIQAK